MYFLTKYLPYYPGNKPGLLQIFCFNIFGLFPRVSRFLLQSLPQNLGLFSGLAYFRFRVISGVIRYFSRFLADIKYRAYTGMPVLQRSSKHSMTMLGLPVSPLPTNFVTKDTHKEAILILNYTATQIKSITILN